MYRNCPEKSNAGTDNTAHHQPRESDIMQHDYTNSQNQDQDQDQTTNVRDRCDGVWQDDTASCQEEDEDSFAEDKEEEEEEVAGGDNESEMRDVDSRTRKRQRSSNETLIRTEDTTQKSKLKKKKGITDKSPQDISCRENQESGKDSWSTV